MVSGVGSGGFSGFVSGLELELLCFDGILSDGLLPSCCWPGLLDGSGTAFPSSVEITKKKNLVKCLHKSDSTEYHRNLFSADGFDLLRLLDYLRYSDFLFDLVSLHLFVPTYHLLVQKDLF